MRHDLKRIFLVGAAFCVLGIASVWADKAVVGLTSTIQVTHGNFSKLVDGGWLLNICAVARQADGGVADVACVPCEVPGMAASNIATCKAKWIVDMGY